MSSQPAVRRRRWTRLDYEHVVECGGFGPQDRIALLDGELWEVSPQGSRHAAVYVIVTGAVQEAFGTGYHVRGQCPVALDDASEPEPDLAVVPGAPRDYLSAHPPPAVLLVEVSESSLSFDRGRKLVAYARNGIPEYWLVDLNADKLEVYRNPSGTGYASKAILGRGDTVVPLHAPDSVVTVADLLP